MTQRNARASIKPGKSRAALTITHPNAAGIERVLWHLSQRAHKLGMKLVATEQPA